MPRIFQDDCDINCVHKKILRNCRIVGYDKKNTQYILQDIKTGEQFRKKQKDMLPGHFFVFTPEQVGQQGGIFMREGKFQVVLE
jgi:hypothetical protein